jgi:HSP20 family protein
LYTLWSMADRDLFANFERMRREMDELFGDVFERAGLPPRGTSPWPAVDVAYAPDPPRAIVTAELAGMKVSELALRVEGRKLIRARSTSRSRSSGDSSAA